MSEVHRKHKAVLDADSSELGKLYAELDKAVREAEGLHEGAAKTLNKSHEAVVFKACGTAAAAFTEALEGAVTAAKRELDVEVEKARGGRGAVRVCAKRLLRVVADAPPGPPPVPLRRSRQRSSAASRKRR